MRKDFNHLCQVCVEKIVNTFLFPVKNFARKKVNMYHPAFRILQASLIKVDRA